MKRFWQKFVCVSVVLVLGCMFFVGCSSERYLKKFAKKQNTYNIDLVLDTDEMTASGYEKFEYENRTDSGVETLVFHLYPRAFREGANVLPYSNLSEARCFPNGVDYGDISINEVKVNGKKSQINFVGEDEDKLEVVLQETCFHGDSAEVEIWFDLELPNCTHRFGYFENNINLGNFYPILAVKENGEYDMTPYYANGDPFYSECANYNVSVTVPESFSVFSSGNETKKEEVNGKVKTRFSALSVRDFALVIGGNFEV